MTYTIPCGAFNVTDLAYNANHFEIRAHFKPDQVANFSYNRQTKQLKLIFLTEWSEQEKEKANRFIKKKKSQIIADLEQRIKKFRKEE